MFLIGTLYSAALGYNYRCILMQLKKLEEELEIQKYILASWRTPIEKLCYKTFCGIPWCGPPEVIKWFFYSFPILTLSTTSVAWLESENCQYSYVLWPLGIAFAIIGFCVPIYYGKKIQRLCCKEIKEIKQQKSNLDSANIP